MCEPMAPASGLRAHSSHCEDPMARCSGSARSCEIAPTSRSRSLRCSAQLEEARQSDTTKDRVIAKVAHELRNLFAGLNSGLQVMRSHAGDEQRQQQVVVADAAAIAGRSLSHRGLAGCAAIPCGQRRPRRPADGCSRGVERCGGAPAVESRGKVTTPAAPRPHRADRGAGRSGQAVPDFHQPDRERRQVHAAARPNLGEGDL